MKSIICLLGVFFLSSNLLFSQNKIVIDVSNEKLNEKKIDKKSDSTDIYIVLPEKKFETINLKINKIYFKFDCIQSDSCISLYSSDIDSGIIVLHFQGAKLMRIGYRDINHDSDILSAKTTINFNDGKNNQTISITGLDKTPSQSKIPERAISFISSFCKDNSLGSASVNALTDTSFLCSKGYLKNCNCGNLIKNQFENMYLPPCFDKHGNAISIKNQILYDMTTEDPIQKVFLFKIKKGKKNNCVDLGKKHFQFARIKRQMAPSVGDIMAVSVVAHKDTLISIDTSYVNYFLDSAKAVETAFTAAGTNMTTATSPAKAATAGLSGEAEKKLQGAVTLKNDLVYFNGYYKDLKFIQEKYNDELACLQLNIVKYFEFNIVPHSGDELALALDNLLKTNELDHKYDNFTCNLLSVIAAEYDTALNRKSDYRIFTRLIQVPNADELTVSMKTSKAASSFYAHKFNIKGGIKIDFSSGVFITGLDDKEFIQTSLRFRYNDSTVTPRIVNRDTTGNLLQANRGKQNFNTGFFVHVYPRTGRFINAGLATGVIFNNSQFSWLLGGSLIFRMGNARLSLTGGLAFGKQKELDANQKQYLYDAKLFPTSTTNPYEKDKLPRFFTDTNISTFDKRTTSWFAGITYNFAGIKL